MTSPVASSNCRECGLSAALCLCAAMPHVVTRTRIVILRHVIEGRRRTNTARIAIRALPNSEIVDHGGRATGFTEEGDAAAHAQVSGKAAALAGPGAWLLYPGAAEEPSGPPPARLIVLDGSWRQARRMFLRIPELRGLPRLSLAQPARPEAPRLRRAPAAGAMATLEAIACALERLEGPELARPLHELYAEFVKRTLQEAVATGKRLGR